MMIGRMILLHSQRIKAIYTVGAADMKSGLAALAIALIEIKESGKLKQGTIKFMATVGEEMEQSGSQQLFEKDMLMI